MADCVIFLDHTVAEQVATRRLRIVKYRGSAHGTNEYPFLIDEHGFSVLPITSLGLDHPASSDRISTGIPRLDTMLGGKGYLPRQQHPRLRHRGDREDQRCRPVRRCGLPARRARPVFRLRGIPQPDHPQHALPRHRPGALGEKGLLRFAAARPTLFGLEMHLVTMHKAIEEFAPTVVVVDPISNLVVFVELHGGQGDAHPADRLPEREADHRPLHRPHHRREAAWSRRRWGYPR